MEKGYSCFHQGLFVVDLSRLSSVIADTSPRLSAAELKAGEKEVGKIDFEKRQFCPISNEIKLMLGWDFEKQRHHF